MTQFESILGSSHPNDFQTSKPIQFLILVDRKSLQTHFKHIIFN